MTPVCSAAGMNWSGASGPEPGVRPADERLGPDDDAVGQRHLGLHVDVDLVPLERLAEVGGEGEAAGRVRIGLGGVDLDAGALLAGPVGGGVGALQEQLGRRRVVGVVGRRRGRRRAPATRRRR